MQPPLIRRCIVEALGTFALVLGIGIAISREISPLYIAATTLALAISFYGYISGGHFNPAVSLAFAVYKKFSFMDLIPYWASQILGANFAVLCLQQSLLGGIQRRMANILPTKISYFSGEYTPLEPLLLEIIGSFLFVTLILNVVSSLSIPAKFKGIGVGLSLVVVCTLFGNKADLSLNPARTLGPAFFNYNAAAYTSKATPAYVRDGLIIALMSLIGGALAGAVHSMVYKDES